MKIYQIDSSARKEGSTSRALAKKLLDKIKKPGDEIIYRDLDDEMVFVSGLTESGMKIHKKDQLEQFENSNNDCNDNNLSDFKPLPPVEPVQMVKPNQYHLQQPNQERVPLEERVNNYNESYYASIPYQNNVDQNIKNKELLHKLNYIITLLEEQKDEKTNNVIEEVILYTFLGIFIIFIIDSFARASKYVR